MFSRYFIYVLYINIFQFKIIQLSLRNTNITFLLTYRKNHPFHPLRSLFTSNSAPPEPNARSNKRVTRASDVRMIEISIRSYVHNSELTFLELIRKIRRSTAVSLKYNGLIVCVYVLLSFLYFSLLSLVLFFWFRTFTITLAKRRLAYNETGALDKLAKWSWFIIDNFFCEGKFK